MNAIFDLHTDCPRSGDSYYLVRAFPLQHQLVCTIGGLNAPKDKDAFLKTLGLNPAAMIATPGLLVACSTRSSPETVLLEKHNIVTSVLILHYIVGKHLR